MFESTNLCSLIKKRILMVDPWAMDWVGLIPILMADF